MANKTMVTLSLFSAILLSWLPSTAQADGVSAQSVLGYFVKYYSTDPTAGKSLTAYGSYMTDIAVLTYQLQADGSVSGFTPTADLNDAKARNVHSYAVIQNNFDADLTRKVISDSTLKQKAINSILTITQNNGYKGVNIDFENMYAADRQLFNSFIKQLSAAGKAKNLELVVSVTAKTSDCLSCSWSGALDYNTLGQSADKIQLMTYDENGPWGEPGPVAGYPWFERVIQYAASQVPSQKLLIGLPAYGYDWNTTTGADNKAVTWKSIPGLITAQNAVTAWNETEKSPTLTYTDGSGNKHVVWYENDKSIELKTSLVNKYNLGGVSVWRMGFENDSFWNAVNSGLSPKLTGLYLSPSALIVDGTRKANIAFNLNKPSKVSISIKDSSSAIVKSLLSDEAMPVGANSVEWNGSGLPFGSYRIEVSAVDGNGLADSASTNVELLDGMAPVISNVSLSNASLKRTALSAATSELQITINEKSQVEVSVRDLSGALIKSLSAPADQLPGSYKWTIDPSTLNDGSYQVVIRAVDDSGNSSTATTGITVVTEKIYGKVTASVLNVRSGPGTTFSVIGSLYYGQLVQVLGKKDDWYLIRYSNTTNAYVHSSYLSLN